MHVAFVAYEYPPYVFGGIGTFSREIAQALSQKGVELSVIAAQSSRISSVEEVNQNFRIFRIPALDLPPRHLWWQIRNHGLILRLLTRLSPDVIHFNNCAFSLPMRKVRKRLKKPIVVTVHGDYRQSSILAQKYARLMDPYDFLTYVCSAPFQEKMLQIDIEEADCTVAVSDHLKRDISERFRARRLTRIYNGVDMTFLQTLQRRSKAYQSDHRKIRIALAGRLYWIKGITYTLKAFASLATHCASARMKVELDIYADGPLRKEVEKYAGRFHEMQCRISYHGVLPRTSFLQELATSDLAVIPSLYEACPMMLFEAMGLGVPVVVSNMPWSAEFIRHKVNGVKADVLEPECFAKMLLELIEDAGLRKTISENAMSEIGKYEISNTASMYLDEYEKLVS